MIKAVIFAADSVSSADQNVLRLPDYRSRIGSTAFKIPPPAALGRLVRCWSNSGACYLISQDLVTFEHLFWQEFHRI
jgi:hypothetical protein